MTWNWLSVENYLAIAPISRATVTKDLQDLVAIGAFSKTGELRHTRYYLALEKQVALADPSRI